VDRFSAVVKIGRPLLLLTLAAFLPLLIFSVAMGVASLRQQQVGLERAAVDRVDRISALIDRELQAQVELLRALAQSPVLDGDTEDVAFAELARRLQRELPLWRSLSLSDREGKRLVDVPEPISGTKGGQVVDKTSHLRVIETASPQVGSIIRGPRDRPAFAIRAPVIRDQIVRSVLSAVVEPTEIRDSLFAAGLPDGWIGAVVDSTGNLVARTAGPPTLIGRPASERAREARMRASGGVYDGVSLEGVRTKDAYRVLPRSMWSVHIAVPLEIYNAPLTRSVWLMAGGALLSLCLMGLFLRLLWRDLQMRRGREHALEEAQRLEALGRMTGGVAHDFNNLLMIMQGSAEALKRRRADPQRVNTFADAILAAAERGQAITRQLLAFAQRSPHEPTIFDLRDRGPVLLGLLQRSTRGDINTSLSVPEGTWAIHADPNALEVALINLAVNAREAMPNGGRLSVEARNIVLTREHNSGTGLSGDFVAIRVSDTGIGIPSEHLGRVFDPFFTTRPAGKGTGLGLSQVYGFAKQSAGGITVESRSTEGTAFTLFLPAASSGEVGAGSPSENANIPASQDIRFPRNGSHSSASYRPTPVAPDPDSPSAIDGGRVLLVEDNREVAQVTEGMLAAAGYEVVWVKEAAAALALIRQGEAFDLVLSDIVMDGGMSGLELARTLQNQWPDLPVVLMTGYSEALVKGSTTGLTILSKPFREVDAIAAIRSARGVRSTTPSGNNVIQIRR
jgi:signal transduction histidine kinase/ActR/RegA family two-component response regulator